MEADLWRKLVVNSPDFIAIVDCDGVIKYANWFDNHPQHDEVVGTSIFQHTVPDHHDVVRAGMKKVFDERESASWQIQAYDESGEIAWWSTLVVPLLDGQSVSEAVLYGRNVTGQKKIEEDLRASERRLIEAERVGKVGHFYWELESDDMYWSDQIYQILGLKPGEVEPSIAAFVDRLPEDERETFNEVADQVQNGKIPPDEDSLMFERTIERADGSQRRIIERSVLTRNDRGELIAMHGVIQDVTDIAEIEVQLQKERDSLARKNTALTEVLRNIEGQIDEIKDAIRRDISVKLDPMFTRLRRRLKPAERAYLEEIVNTLSEITEPVIGPPQQPLRNLTPRETEVCNWIKKGYTSREIASVLEISPQTVDKFRQRIRRKLDITDKRVNLTNYLRDVAHHVNGD